MKKIFNLVSVCGLLLGSTGTPAATFGGDKPLLCAAQTVSECVVGQTCQGVTPDEVNLPNFVLVDAANKVLVATPESGMDRKTAIEYSEQLDGKLILQGADDGIEGERDGLAWSMAIDDTTGKMVMSAAGDGFALVVFGACTVW